jgi:hypothetical protein
LRDNFLDAADISVHDSLPVKGLDGADHNMGFIFAEKTEVAVRILT